SPAMRRDRKRRRPTTTRFEGWRRSSMTRLRTPWRFRRLATRRRSMTSSSTCTEGRGTNASQHEDSYEFAVLRSLGANSELVLATRCDTCTRGNLEKQIAEAHEIRLASARTSHSEC